MSASLAITIIIYLRTGKNIQNKWKFQWKTNVDSKMGNGWWERPKCAVAQVLHIIMMFGTNFKQATVMMLHLLRISFIKIAAKSEIKLFRRRRCRCRSELLRRWSTVATFHWLFFSSLILFRFGWWVIATRIWFGFGFACQTHFLSLWNCGRNNYVCVCVQPFCSIFTFFFLAFGFLVLVSLKTEKHASWNEY